MRGGTSPVITVIVIAMVLSFFVVFFLGVCFSSSRKTIPRVSRVRIESHRYLPRGT